jgi:hypothetical protein
MIILVTLVYELYDQPIHWKFTLSRLEYREDFSTDIAWEEVFELFIMFYMQYEWSQDNRHGIWTLRQPQQLTHVFPERSEICLQS